MDFGYYAVTAAELNQHLTWWSRFGCVRHALLQTSGRFTAQRFTSQPTADLTIALLIGDPLTFTPMIDRQPLDSLRLVNT